MKFFLIITLLMLSLSSQAQTVCFENEKVKMLDVIDLEKQNVSRPTSDKVTKLAAAQKDAVKETKVIGYSLNSDPKEDIKVYYYKNSASEDVAVFKYNGKKYYKVRNLKNGCTAIYTNDSAVKEVSLLASLPANTNDSFYSNGISSVNYKDGDLDGVVATTGQTETNECRVVNDGVSMFSVDTNSNGRIKFCTIEAICKGRDDTEKAFCKAVDDKCPSYEDCDKDDSFKVLFEDFQKGTLRKETQSKASAQ